MSGPSTTAREAILAAVRAARPPAVAGPDAPWRETRASSDMSRIDVFAAAAIAAGAAVVPCFEEDVARVADAAAGDARAVLSYVDGVRSTVAPQTAPHALADLDLLICESNLGVAENGAVWFATSDVSLRAALYLAARVVVVVAERDLVDDLHQAYERIDLRAQPFGAFVAGPSKTADIEQSLVIGAHGPKELTLVVVRTRS
jgi:L-lactate dehydrogenase complex protein LldG